MVNREKSINEKFIKIERNLNKELIDQEELLHNIFTYFKENLI